MKIIPILLAMVLLLCSCAAGDIRSTGGDLPTYGNDTSEEPPATTIAPSTETPIDDNDDIIIMQDDINDTVEIMLPFWGDHEINFFNSDDMKQIIITDDEYNYNHYEIWFYLTPDAISKAELPYWFISDFPMRISVYGKNIFEFVDKEGAYTSPDDNTLYVISRSFSDINEGIKGFISWVNGNGINREYLRELFSK